MSTDERVLVIFLSAALAVFLVLGIAAIIMFIQILNRIKELAERAEDLAEKAEAVGEFFQKTAKPAMIINTIAKIARTFKSKK